MKDNTPICAKRRSIIITAICLCALLILSFVIVTAIKYDSPLGFLYVFSQSTSGSDTAILDPAVSSESHEPELISGFVAAASSSVNMVLESKTSSIPVIRGTAVEYENESSDVYGYVIAHLPGGASGYISMENIVSNIEDAVLEKSIYVRTPQNLLPDGKTALSALVKKGEELVVSGFDTLNEDGSVKMYLVKFGDEEGYIRSEYTCPNYEDAISVYDEGGTYQIHLSRGDKYGGGDGGSLDFFPREKVMFEDNVMPAECHTLYLCADAVPVVDAYIEYAKTVGINAFVVDILDGSAVAYPSPVMEKYSPATFAAAQMTLDDYKVAIDRIKSAGFYVIGRITVFNDPNLVLDHPECAISGVDGNPLKIGGNYWPSAYDRTVWQYKTELAAEAANLMIFNEIQLDYVRFPDRTVNWDRAGTIDYHNAFGETKAQAIQGFLMYACDILHEQGVYVGADVFGEAAFTYVTAYGQYWPAISNVVDVISGMPYPDHFGADGTYRPWEHPYRTIYNWGTSAFARQQETATPAVVRTWIQAYDAIKEPFNKYTAAEVGDEIRALRDAGLHGGYMTWNGISSLEKYRQLAAAFNL